LSKNATHVLLVLVADIKVIRLVCKRNALIRLDLAGTLAYIKPL